MAKPRRPPEIEREQPGPTHLAKLAGIKAYFRGDKREASPYIQDSPEWRCWGYGWQEAKNGEWDIGGPNDV